MLPGSEFKLASFTFHLEAQTKIELPAFKGSLFRGSFGKTFRRIVCLQRQERCDNCRLAKNCSYLFLFESPQYKNGDHKWKTSHEPHPFVLEPPLDEKRVYLPGENFCVGLTLVGEGISYLPYFIMVFEEMGGRGIGYEKGMFCVNAMTAAGPAGEVEVYSGKDKALQDEIPLITPAILNEQMEKKTTAITINFLTPARLQQQGKLMTRIEFPLLIRALMRRYSWLSLLYCHNLPDLPYAQLLTLAENEVRLVRANLAWREWERYSFRQQQKVKLGGVVGETIFVGNLVPFLPLIKLGEYLHIGKGTVFGLGKYILTTN